MNMASAQNKSILSNLKKHVKFNWGTPFIMVFILLLMTIAAFLSVGQKGLLALTDDIAVSAFLVLIAGIVLQAVGYLVSDFKGETKP
jgi:hypothetical protein